MGRISTRRLALGIIAVAMVPLGLSARYLTAGLLADLSGGVLYAALFYVLFAFLLPRRTPWLPAALSLCWCFGIEFLQLTALPANFSATFPAAHLVFGSGFAALDLAAYLAGVALAAGVDLWVRRRSGIAAS